jgi:outer membrane protein assembly factor BamE (lipoprotein component of BamABCDE complex)
MQESKREALMIRNVLMCVVLAGLLIAGAGCLVGVSSNDSRTGNYVAQNTINQIQPNQTTRGWVAGIIGEPTSKVKVDEATEVWKYSYNEKHESSGAVFLIFGGSNVKETSHALFIEFHGDLVSRFWQG